MSEPSLDVARVLIPGAVTARALVLDEPLSFWGGLDAATGVIVDMRHPQAGQCVTGIVLVMTTGRGSSSAASVLAEAIRRGTAPAALVMQDSDEIIVLGAIVAEELYELTMPIVLVSAETLDGIATGDTVDLQALA